MLKKLILVSFMISILFLISCTEPTSSDPGTPFRLVESNRYYYNDTDSTWIPNYSDYYNYDDHNRLGTQIEIVPSNLNENNYVYTYDTISDVSPKEWFVYLGVKWIFDDHKYEFIYEDGKAVEIKALERVVDDIYENVLKIEYTYEGNLLVNEVLSLYGDSGWIEMGNVNWIYESSKLVECVSDSDRMLYIYSNGLLSEIQWYEGSNLSRREEFAFQNGYLKEKLIYSNPFTSMAEEPPGLSSKVVYEFDGIYLSSKNEYIWAGETAGWLDDIQTEFVYDIYGNMITEIEYYWYGGVFVPDDKTDYIYEEASGNYTDILRAMYPEMFYTGLDYQVIDPEPTPTKCFEADDKLLKLLEDRK